MKIGLMAAKLMLGLLTKAERALQYGLLPWHSRAIRKAQQNPMAVLSVVLSCLVCVLAALLILVLRWIMLLRST